MGLLDVNLSKEDRLRVDRALALPEAIKRFINTLISGHEVVLRLSIEPKIRHDDIQK